jgi:hypothetical protein
MPDSGCYPPDYGAGLVLVTTTEDVTRYIAMFRPGVNRNMGSGEEEITGDAVGSKTVEMTVEDLDISAFKCRIKNSFPEVLGIDLVRTAAEELDQMMDAVRCAVRKRG